MAVAFFITGLVASGFGSKRVLHELEHATIGAAVDGGQETQFSAGNNVPDDLPPMSDSEHRLLHALAHCEAGLVPSSEEPCVSAAQAIPLLPVMQVVLSADAELSLRPPRSI